MKGFLCFGLLALLGVAGCKDASSGKDKPAKSVENPPAPAVMQNEPPKPAPAPVQLTRPVEPLGPLLDKFNACVKEIAQLVQSTDTAVIAPVEGKIRECRGRFDAVLAFGGRPVNEEYTEYLVAAARLVAQLPVENPGRKTESFPVQAFIDAYNALALKNNELIGVSATDEEPAPPEKLPRRSYREIVEQRFGEIANAVAQWHFSHRFETLALDAPAAWLKAKPEERARLFVLRTRLENRMKTLLQTRCEDAGGDGDRISCDSLVQAAGDAGRRLSEWLQAWDRFLQEDGAACAPCEKARQDLDFRLGSLPKSTPDAP